ncbi:3'-5' exonuclease [Sulfurimonas aquatica]|uniref:3'-5' exonuclease n=1 Tax=Sulfurimonas aquatica TaxID=2672570 RepID=A0A975AYZ6_9BACT|nr:3'-5' exonuclease [Sulfurimonas aquatica]QSZ41113.1 3'-5' exonuclease [Sulfurimonas aquatica]
MHNKEFPLDKKSVSRLASRGLPLEVLKSQIDDSIDFFMELSRAKGLNIIKKQGYFYFDTKYISIEDAEFCIVDIETNGSKIEKHQIIEIAAVKVKNGVIVDRFESLVYTKEINPHITEITGISAGDTVDAPDLKTVMLEFKLFLGDAIFIAHDVKFDFTFVSKTLRKIGLEDIFNRALCSLALAERTIVSYRYGLSYLNDTFDLNTNATHHRAMSDVMTTYGLFLLSLENCTESLNNVEDLIKFSKEAPRLKRPKFDPFLLKEEEIETQEL